MSQNTSSKTFLHLAVMTFVLLGLSITSISTLTFFSSDTGLRFFQIQQLIEQNWRTFAVQYPADYLDPIREYFPYYHAFSVVDDQIFLHISPFFPLASAYLYALVGVTGLSFVPVLGTVLTARTVYRLVRLSDGESAHLAFWMTAFATPLLFYTLELWDHTIGTALMLLGVYGVARGLQTREWPSILLGGIAMGLAPGQRPEAYVFGVMVGGALLIVVNAEWRWSAFATYVSGGLIGILPVGILQYYWIGHPLGISTARRFFGFGTPAVVPFTPPDVETLTLGQQYALKVSSLLVHTDSTLSLLATICIAAGIVGIILALRSQRWQKAHVLLGSVIMCVIGYVIVAAFAIDKPVTGIISTFPLIPLSLTYVDKEVDSSRPEQRRVYLLVLLTIVLYVGFALVLEPADGGKQWGARYLLSTYPLLLYLALYAFQQYRRHLDTSMARALRSAGAVLLVVAIVIQTLGARIVYAEHYRQAAMRDTIDEMQTEIVLTNGPYLASLMSSLDEKIFMYVDDEQQLRVLLRRLVKRDITRFAVIPLDQIPLEVPKAVDGHSIQQVDRFVYEIGN